MFKRTRSKSDKQITPPRIVYGDLSSAYRSIAQKSSSNIPHVHTILQEISPTDFEVNNAQSSVQSPQSEASPTAALLSHRSPTVIRMSHLSADLFLPKHSDSPEPGTKPEESWDPFETSQNRSSIATIDFKKQVLNGYFGVTPKKDGIDLGRDQNESRRETDLLSVSDYPELEHSQLEACSKLSAAGNLDEGKGHDLDPRETIQSVSRRHHYGQLGNNEEIRSTYCSREEDEALKGYGEAQKDEVEQVEWTPRSSIELNAPASMPQQQPGVPPSFALPRTPKGKETARYRLEDPSSPSEENSRSSESYGNTNRLLQLSLPQIPEGPVPRNNLYRQLVQFAREGQSSSSHGNSSNSFGEFSIEEAHGGQITRPVSQEEFEDLERAISSHLSRKSRMSEDTVGASLVHVGQISLRYRDTSFEAGSGPGSSQTASSRSEVEVDWETGSVQVPLRTRNGTPPLLFRGLNRPRNEADWETVGDSNEMTSIADVSDSASMRPSRSFPSIPSGKVLKHPAHPRYNHSWDLQQDVQSGAFVLIPRHEQVSGGSSFPNQNALEPLASRTAQNNYSHPTPLTGSHSHPFAAPPVKIAPAERSRLNEFEQHIEAVDSQNQLRSQGSSAWLSTAATTAAPLPPLPKKNPSRLLKQRHNFDFGLQTTDNYEIDQMSAMEEGSVISSPSTQAAAVATALTSVIAPDVPGSSVRLRSPNRYLADKPSLNRSNNGDPPLNPLDDAASHGSPAVADSVSALAFPENTFSPAHRCRAGAVRARDFISAEQAHYIRAQSPSWAPTSVEMQAIISPVASVRAPRAPGAVVPRLWIPTPHPLAHLSPREDSPHLWHLRPVAKSRRRLSQQQVVSRYYLVVCAFLPVLLAPYCLGALDWIIRVHTGGLYREMGGHEKRMALLILCVELLGAVAFVPLAFSLL
ncbi:MAG: hypothetical protein L6R40_005032 [Gallowayella cf. fulva]|nr:MAG: hypothetical protein L6R40_005032 [Xanthomendoza cf. fulva]